MIFAVLEILFALFVILFTVTQVIIPFFKGTPLLPIFGEKVAVEQELEVARQRVEIAKLEQELEELRKKAESLKPQPTTKEGDHA